MRVTGAADPRTPIEDTLEASCLREKSHRKQPTDYSSYGNRRLATGLVDEVYHDNYVAREWKSEPLSVQHRQTT